MPHLFWHATWYISVLFVLCFSQTYHGQRMAQGSHAPAQPPVGVSSQRTAALSFAE